MLKASLLNLSDRNTEDGAVSVWPAWKVREHGGTTSWFQVRLAFPDGAHVDALAVLHGGCVSIEDVSAQPALSFADLTALARWIEGPLFASCGVPARRPDEEEGDQRPAGRDEGELPAGRGEGELPARRDEAEWPARRLEDMRPQAAPVAVQPTAPRTDGQLHVPCAVGQLADLPAHEQVTAPRTHEQVAVPGAPEQVAAPGAHEQLAAPRACEQPAPREAECPQGRHAPEAGDTVEAVFGVGPWRARPGWPRGVEGRRLVAREYRAAQAGGVDPVLAVMTATGRSRRRSLRLIAQARDAGFLTRHARRR
ncbi:hypothetical protein GCM10010339_28580 [Streptomyces alanosinicus]|uniref:Uncharacterized protein n=1 Tax=Streptomyces alanosinicus TaxID=68171 RepID=A0A918YHG7_9ACTN|nr:hypothetical protein GCM10010339_28580 [Streptomyces alanosinicus]